MRTRQSEERGLNSPWPEGYRSIDLILSCNSHAVCTEPKMVSTKLFYVRCLRERALKLGPRARKDRSYKFIGKDYESRGLTTYPGRI